MLCSKLRGNPGTDFPYLYQGPTCDGLESVEETLTLSSRIDVNGQPEFKPANKGRLVSGGKKN
jgi:hypothetical protein